MKKPVLNFVTCLLFVIGAFSVSAQTNISVSGSFGWAVPGGSGISEDPEDLNLDGGLVWTLDALYHVNGNLAVGLQRTAAILAGAGGGDVDLFGMNMIGAKGMYFLKEEGFTPFAGLSIGIGQLKTPEYSVTSGGSTTTVPANTGSGFGIMPEVGLSFGKLFLVGRYLVPVSYDIEDVISDKAAGMLTIELGYRLPFSF